MNRNRFCRILIRMMLAMALTTVADAGQGMNGIVHSSAPELLDYEELVLLSDHPEPDETVAAKLQHLLDTPFIGNNAYFSGITPLRPEFPSLGPSLRAAVWNIERGTEFDLIVYAFNDPDALVDEIGHRADNGSVNGSDKVFTAYEESIALAKSDVVIINEADLGMTRTGYRHVAEELAAVLNMNYAFGVEFVEVDRIKLGLEDLTITPDMDVTDIIRDIPIDAELYRGLHGNAILSRYPIQEVKILRFSPCYDWYEQEKTEIAFLEQGRRMAASTLFQERISREVRLGNRMALIADLLVPESPTGKLTVVSVHLENKCKPACRQLQIKELLEDLKDNRNPIIMGGDLNTSGSDNTPTSLRHEIFKRVTSPGFWSGQLLTWLTPTIFPRLILTPTNHLMNYLDPTARNIPFIASNREHRFFSLLRNFLFSDGTRFDFRGDPDRSTGGRGGTLSNSNERAVKGFTATYSFNRDFGGIFGRMRLDWVLVKPPPSYNRKTVRRHHFEPYYGRTLSGLNDLLPSQISDHHPIIVDVPLEQKFVSDGIGEYDIIPDMCWESKN
jgi:endonuclease/exonuclease/phosphatase family metal-dependent hydrolase